MTPDVDAKLSEVLRSVLELSANQSVTNASQESVEKWDSLGHVTLMLALEGEFGLTIDLADQLELKSYAAIRAYLERAMREQRSA